jgi:hypothetical protein
VGEEGGRRGWMWDGDEDGDEGSGRDGGRKRRGMGEMKQRRRLHEEVSVGTEVLLKTFDIKQDAYIFMYISTEENLIH